MERVVQAATVGRAILSLARSGRTGVLRATSGPLVADIAVVEGRIRAIRMPSDDELIGDTLLRDGSLDVAAHASALASRAETGPVGEWLVRSRATSGPALASALRVQLRRRVRKMLGWPRPTLRFEPGQAEVGVPHVSEPDTSASIVLGAIRDLLRDEPPDVALRRLGTSRLTLSPVGELLVRDAPLWPEEAALVPLLREAHTPDVLIARGGDNARPLRWLRAMQLLGAVTAVDARRRSHAALVAKNDAVRRGASASELLGVGPRADARSARRALRKLAAALHPDTMGPDVPEALRVASTNVMIALARAEETLRARTRSKP